MRTQRPRSRGALIAAFLRALRRADDPSLSAGARALSRLRTDMLALDLADELGLDLPVDEVLPAARLRLVLRLEGGDC